MDQLVACPDCGTSNRSDADLCSQCWRALNDEAFSKIPITAFAPPAPPVPAPPKAPPRTLRPAPAPVEPERPSGEATPGPVPYFAPAKTETAPAQATNVESGWAPPLARKRYLWKWYHLALVGLSAWGLPFFSMWTLIGDKTGRALIDASLAVQVGAYLIAALALACLVQMVQGGDWDSVGLRRSERTPLDFALGALTGLVLIASFLAGLYFVTGSFEPDFATRFLLGGTTGPGAVLGAIVLVVGAPVIEEAYFRGMLFQRFARWGMGAAIVGTSVLFVLAHGVGIWDPPRLLLGFALGFARRTKSLWFTIAGHAAWNGAIVFMALFMMTGSGHDFTSSDGSFTLRHPAQWERVEQAEMQTPGGGMEMLMVTPEGSTMAVMTMQSPQALNRWSLTQIAQQAQQTLPLPPSVKMEPLQETHVIADPRVTAYQSKMRISDPMMGSGNGRLVLVVKDGSQSMVMLLMACPDVDCAEAEPEFDSMLKSLQFV